MKGNEAFTSHCDADTSCQDSDVVAAMKVNGFDTQDTKDLLKHKSLKKPRSCIPSFGTRYQDNDYKIQAKVRNSGVTSFSSAEDPDTFSLYPQEKSQCPSIWTLMWWTDKDQWEQRVVTNAPVLQERTPILSIAYKGSMTEPYIYLLSSSGVHTEDTSFSYTSSWKAF